MRDKTPLTLLYVEDEPAIRKAVTKALEYNFEKVFTAANGKEGLDIFIAENPDIVVSDIRMPKMDGIELARKIFAVCPGKPIIFTTAFTETEYLLKSIELGIAAYVCKPLDSEQLLDKLNQIAAPIIRLRALEKTVKCESNSLEWLLGNSDKMGPVLKKVQQVASTDYSIVIQGETGTGKSHLASIIHRLSSRRHNPFITLNVSALPESLIESELFGYSKGAFTGAVSAKAGLFTEAHGGTLFIDDIDCASPAVQAKILHAVEQKSFTPLGGTKKVEVDFRIISASNCNLLQESQHGRFRSDLYYRLADLVITLPPLRERVGDISMLAGKFLNEAALELNITPPRITPDAIRFLSQSSWPGNVRELKSIMRRVALLGENPISSTHIAEALDANHIRKADESTNQHQSFDELIRKAVADALEASGGKKTEAAHLLKLEYRKFKRILDKYQM